MKIWRDWTIFERVWLLTFTLINIYLFFAWDDTILGLITSISGMLCVVLVAKGKVSNFYFGIIQTGTYAYISYGYGLYGEVMLNALFYFPLQFVGIYLWKQHTTAIKIKGEDIQIKALTKKGWIATLTSFLIIFVLYALLLQKIGGNVVWIDSATTTLSVIAQILMLKRYTQQWLLWIAVNVLSIVLWVKALILQGGNDVSMLVMWSAFLINSIYGYYNWTKVYKKQKGEVM
ncbi:nicotinamide riboside transporter PnuC [Bacillus sp. DTU_2020_1000418_1_SI_GHA_SEK_038]|uniref:nicotinamide riboside transporter PnuC n=1 Tax=Bacillus sp. DTU_2020_1000418_1_SI_GHA_SEK_038 TaxID=3077585 RepID=UPI0028E308DC|nr:nicotinamide riboside transporter PnuC [Bacillus sp. DTU_2020_1000418_1_SI_GHA_SEK_038]WNS73696.1 nicotinamide riboside transporter PnuC [Bacillus sp. DTU_2020_1000418_1_SI_GHA_SEK_038]